LEAVAAAGEPSSATRPLAGWHARCASGLAVALAAYSIYWVLFVVQPQIYRVTFLLAALTLTFLLFPATRVRDARPTALDWVLIGGACAALIWPIADFERFVRRAAEPGTLDLVLGTVTIGLVLEATRRTVGPILPVTAIGFLAYAWLGPWLDGLGLSLIAHRGYGLERLVGALYMSLEGIFGVPLDVAATYIVLFTIYGAVLELSGAGAFFIRWAMSMSGRSPAAAGRSVTLAGFLLGSVSGSGVATTVMLGSVTWPLLRRAGHSPESAGAMLSAAGIGALLSPPTLGAAAFLIAEYLRISYLQVLVMATVPTLLYYLSILVMIEAESRRHGPGSMQPAGREAAAAATEPLWRSSYHFTSLIAIAVFMVLGMSAFRAVFWAMVLAIALSFLRRETAMTPTRIIAALGAGGRDILGVAATTATAGIVVGVVTLTGLGLKISGLIVALAGGTLVLTVVYAAIAVWVLGLAVPVTASYIIAAVMVAPALVSAGVPDYAAHMFIFYYAVLSEVSPPTALSPFAAAALTGGNPFRTMIRTWKYTLPAFVVPLVFTIRPDGDSLLLHGAAVPTARTIALALAGITAIAAGAGGWIRRSLTTVERVATLGAGTLLLAGDGPIAVVGAAVGTLVLILQFTGRPPSADSKPGP
jgi:TRAP transporter 4TM/12TM fusion protein